MGVLRRATKALPGYIHFGGGTGYVTPPGQDITIVSPWDSTGTRAGMRVDTETAMTFPAFYAGVRLISESVGRIPLVLYRRTGENARERHTGTALYDLLHDEFNPEMTAFTGKSTMQGHIICRGNAYAEKEYDDLGRLRYLWPLRPDRMAVLRDSESGRKFYRYRLITGEDIDFRADQIFHVPGFGYDGYVGYSLVSLFREALAVGLSAQEYAARFFRSGMAASAVVTHPAGWGDPKIKEFASKIRANYSGLSNAQRIAILEEGVTWENVGMNLDDAQFLETRKFQKAEVATILNVPPHMLQDVERSTSWGTGIEEQTLGFVTFSLGNHLDRFAAESNRQLVKPAYPTDYAEFLIEVLLKSRPEDRARFYQVLWSMGVLNPDTIAQKENLPKPEGGETYYVPVNYQAVSAVLEQEELDRRAAQNGAGSLPVNARDLARELSRNGGNGNGAG